jgi:hypothetical protein
LAFLVSKINFVRIVLRLSIFSSGHLDFRHLFCTISQLGPLLTALTVKLLLFGWILLFDKNPHLSKTLICAAVSLARGIAEYFAICGELPEPTIVT